MKENYLWNKTGEDPEIEHLENALRVFRWQENAPPALPAKIIPFEAKSPRRFFRLPFAFAGFAVLTVICLGVWFQFAGGGNTEVAKNAPETTAPQKTETLAKDIQAEKQVDLPVEKFETPKQLVERKQIKVIKTAAPIVRKNNPVVARNINTKKSSEELTKEETYAYNQLMLALSITGSKLKLVQDKVDGVEENKKFRDGK